MYNIIFSVGVKRIKLEFCRGGLGKVRILVCVWDGIGRSIYFNFFGVELV